MSVKKYTKEGFEILRRAENIEISLDRENNILVCRWVGFQHEKPLRDAGAVILRLLKKYKCSKVLNDNLEVIGLWDHSSGWTAKEWFPQMVKAGLLHFAWVCSRDMFGQMSAELALPGKEIVKTFYVAEEAMEWLKSKV